MSSPRQPTEGYLALLDRQFASLREDQRTDIQLLGNLFNVAVAIAVGISAALISVDLKPPDEILFRAGLVAFPMLPLSAFAWAGLLHAQITVRLRYLMQLEKAVFKDPYYDQRPSDPDPLVDLPTPFLHFMQPLMGAPKTSMRRWAPEVTVNFLPPITNLLSFVAATIVTMLLVRPWPLQAATGVVYAGLGAMVIAATLRSRGPAIYERLFQEADKRLKDQPDRNAGNE